MSHDDLADDDGSEDAHAVGGRVGEPHERAREVGRDVDVIDVLAGVVEPVQPARDAEQRHERRHVAAHEREQRQREGGTKACWRRGNLD